MPVKFSNSNYWSPAEQVSRTLFRSVVEIPNEILTNGELQIIRQIQNQIKLYVWLLNCENYSGEEMISFETLINKSLSYAQVAEDYSEVYNK